MSPEATFAWLTIALACFVAGAAVSFFQNPRNIVTTLLCAGLAAWVVVPWWVAVKAL